jgi:hypothetical protein
MNDCLDLATAAAKIESKKFPGEHVAHRDQGVDPQATLPFPQRLQRRTEDALDSRAMGLAPFLEFRAQQGHVCPLAEQVRDHPALELVVSHELDDAAPHVPQGRRAASVMDTRAHAGRNCREKAVLAAVAPLDRRDGEPGAARNGCKAHASWRMRSSVSAAIRARTVCL